MRGGTRSAARCWRSGSLTSTCRGRSGGGRVRMTAAAPTARRPKTAPGAKDPRPAASRLREFVTPEGVDLRLRIAEASERAGAYILDLVFINLALVVLLFAALGAALTT